MNVREAHQLEFRCDMCGYGVVVVLPPEACPICRSNSWVLVPGRKEPPMSANDDMVSDLMEELAADQKLESAAITVSANDGRVTLRGTVGSLDERREASAVASRVFGVVWVRNELEVR
jgi:BON domain